MGFGIGREWYGSGLKPCGSSSISSVRQEKAVFPRKVGALRVAEHEESPLGIEVLFVCCVFYPHSHVAPSIGRPSTACNGTFDAESRWDWKTKSHFDIYDRIGKIAAIDWDHK